jgi:hypothetical protein
VYLSVSHTAIQNLAHLVQAAGAAIALLFTPCQVKHHETPCYSCATATHVVSPSSAHLSVLSQPCLHYALKPLKGSKPGCPTGWSHSTCPVLHPLDKGLVLSQPTPTQPQHSVHVPNMLLHHIQPSHAVLGPQKGLPCENFTSARDSSSNPTLIHSNRGTLFLHQGVEGKQCNPGLALQPKMVYDKWT